ncbi:MAG: hypothetical protein NE328_11885 [Lentisphaeraceae bacterium]|nr:hypothetical protein [Lentisphaeraceae bacterium]
MIQAPETIEASVLTLEPVLTALPTVMGVNKTALDAVNFSYSPGQLTATATMASIVQAALDSALKNNGVAMVVHPWSYGVAETGKGRYTAQAEGYLSQDNANNHLIQKLLDTEDAKSAAIEELIYVSVAANSTISFLTKVSALNSVFPLSGLELCQRRTSQLLSIESTKMNQKTGAILPRFNKHAHNNILKVKELKEKGDRLTAICQAYEDDSNPITELKEVIDEKISEATAAESEWTSLLASLSGSQGQAFFINSGSIVQIAEDIEDIATQVNKFCALVAIGGPAGSLSVLKEIFGL